MPRHPPIKPAYPSDVYANAESIRSPSGIFGYARARIIRALRLPPGLLPFIAAALLAVVLGVWTRAGDPSSAALGAGLVTLVALLVVAERRHR